VGLADNNLSSLKNFKVITGIEKQVSSKERLILLMGPLLCMPGRGIPGKQLITGKLT
jgi:hypothetical protein